MSQALCVATRLSLAALDAGDALDGPRAEHLAQCLRCQAEAVRSRALRRWLAGLATTTQPAPDGFTEAVMESITTDAPGARRPLPSGVAAAGAAAVVAAGTLVVLRHLRRAA